MTDQELADKVRAALLEASNHITELMSRGYTVDAELKTFYSAAIITKIYKMVYL